MIRQAVIEKPLYPWSYLVPCAIDDSYWPTVAGQVNNAFQHDGSGKIPFSPEPISPNSRRGPGRVKGALAVCEANGTLDASQPAEAALTFPWFGQAGASAR